MNVTALDNALWLASFLVQLSVLAVLLLRHRWRLFPCFTAFVALGVLETIGEYYCYSHGLNRWYSRVYWSTAWPEFALQLGIAFDIARIVLRPTGTWVRDARGLFFTVAIGGAAVAALLTWWITPAHTSYSVWDIRGNLFDSLVICEVFVAVGVTANRLGLGWRSHVMALGQALTAWATVLVLTTALQTYFGHHLYADLSRVRITAYMSALAWIGVQLWRDEPERQPISEDLQRYILALHRRVEYDLRRLDAGG